MVNKKGSHNWVLSAEISLVMFTYGGVIDTFLSGINNRVKFDFEDSFSTSKKRWNFKYDWLVDKITELDEVFDNLAIIEEQGGKGIGELDKGIDLMRAEYLYRNYIKKDIIKIQNSKLKELRYKKGLKPKILIMKIMKHFKNTPKRLRSNFFFYF